MFFFTFFISFIEKGENVCDEAKEIGRTRESIRKEERKKKSMNGNVIRWAKGQDGGQGRSFCNFSISFINSDSTAA